MVQADLLELSLMETLILCRKGKPTYLNKSIGFPLYTNKRWMSKLFSLSTKVYKKFTYFRHNLLEHGK